MKTSSFTKSYNGNTVLSLPDLELRPGTIYAILGANGAGKSTMLRILGGLEKADHGNAALKNVSAGFLPQKPFALYMSTLRNLLANSDRDEKAEVIKSEVNPDQENIEEAVKTVEFESDKFSVYGVVGTGIITTTFLSADGNSYEVTVSCDTDAKIPAG